MEIIHEIKASIYFKQKNEDKIYYLPADKDTKNPYIIQLLGYSYYDVDEETLESIESYVWERTRIKKYNNTTKTYTYNYCKAYNICDLSKDELTKSKLLSFYMNVASKRQIIQACELAAADHMEAINFICRRYPQESKDQPNFGKWFEYSLCEQLNKIQSNYKYESCPDENADTDFVSFKITPIGLDRCESFDMECKTAVNDNNYKNHKCQNIEKSRKTKSMDEFHYYILCRLERDYVNMTCKIKEIYFGRICEDHWTKESKSQTSYLKKHIILKYFDKLL